MSWNFWYYRRHHRVFTLLNNQVALLGLILGLAFLWSAVRMIREGLLQTKKPQTQGGSIQEPIWGWTIMGLLIGILTGVV